MRFYPNPDLRVQDLRRRARADPGNPELVQAAATAAWRGGEYTPLEWLIATQTEFDLHMDRTSPGGYIPAVSVLGNRWDNYHTDRIKEIGEDLFGINFYAEHTEGRTVWVTHKDNRGFGQWRAWMEELQRAVERGGYKTFWDYQSDPGFGSLYALMPALGREAVELAHPVYLEWLRSLGGASGWPERWSEL